MGFLKNFPRIFGSRQPNINTDALDPFVGILPWELCSRETLTVNKNNNNEIDSVYAKKLLEFAGVCTILKAVNINTIENCDKAADIITTNCRELVHLQGIDPDREEGFSFKGLHQRDPGRIDIRNHIALNSFPFNDKDFGPDAAWMPIIHNALGANATLLWKGIVVTDPGCKQQMYHPDGPPVSANEWKMAGEDIPENTTVLPPHSLTVFVPLADLTPSRGATSFLCGTQHESTITKFEVESLHPGENFGIGNPAIIYSNAGDATIFDIRVRHAGAANTSQDRRAILYMVWAKKWYDKKMHRRLLEEAGFASGEVVEKLFEVFE